MTCYVFSFLFTGIKSKASSMPKFLKLVSSFSKSLLECEFFSITFNLHLSQLFSTPSTASFDAKGESSKPNSKPQKLFLGLLPAGYLRPSLLRVVPHGEYAGGSRFDFGASRFILLNRRLSAQSLKEGSYETYQRAYISLFKRRKGTAHGSRSSL